MFHRGSIREGVPNCLEALAITLVRMLELENIIITCSLR